MMRAVLLASMSVVSASGAAGDGATAQGVANATASSRCAGHVSSGYEHSCAVTASQALQCWGSNDHGQLNVPPGYAWARVSAGKFHTCGITTSASLICWGRDKHHEAETLAEHSWADVSAGATFTCAVTTTGRALCWGNNHYQQADVPAGHFVSVDAGFGEHACGIESSRSVACWGQDTDGQASAPGGYEWAQVAPGWLHTCGLVTARRPGARPASASSASPGPSAAALPASADGVGQILCWGNNDFGQLDVPGLLPHEGSGWVSVTSGHSFSCGVTDAGALKCWGHLAFGMSKVPPGVRWVEVSGGYYHACGFSSDERLHCWGLNYDGQTEVPEGFAFSSACAAPAVPHEHKAGRGGCPANQLALQKAGMRSRAQVIQECERVQCGYYVWATPNAAGADGAGSDLAGRAWFCHEDYFGDVVNGQDWAGWEVGRLKVGCDAREGDVRLSAYPRGEAYVFEGGVWTTLCGTLDLDTANVVCRQLGYDHATLTYAYWGPEYAYQTTHAPRCRGREAHLSECEQVEAACAAQGGHRQDQGIECAGGRAGAAGGPDAGECGTAPVAAHARAPVQHAVELEVTHEHHGRTVAPIDLADVLGYESVDALVGETPGAASGRWRRSGGVSVVGGGGGGGHLFWSGAVHAAACAGAVAAIAAVVRNRHGLTQRVARRGVAAAGTTQAMDLL